MCIYFIFYDFSNLCLNSISFFKLFIKVIHFLRKEKRIFAFFFQNKSTTVDFVNKVEMVLAFFHFGGSLLNNGLFSCGKDIPVFFNVDQFNPEN